ncbi:hypothetical protein DL768_011799 [Monosporascus sp. mg162]|nr:hypothetical protein DL768_011799 [Monosporascus sp. mg162]
MSRVPTVWECCECSSTQDYAYHQVCHRLFLDEASGQQYACGHPICTACGIWWVQQDGTWMPANQNLIEEERQSMTRKPGKDKSSYKHSSSGSSSKSSKGSSSKDSSKHSKQRSSKK